MIMGCVFPSCLRGFGENVWPFSPRLRFLLLLLLLFFRWRLSRAPGSVHSGSATWDDCDWVFLEELRVSSFLDRFPHYTCTAAVSPLRLRWVKGVCVFRCNPPSALLAEWPGSFTCHCGNTGVERTPSKSQHTKLTLGKKILPLLLPGFELATFRSQVRCFYQQAIPAPLGAKRRLSESDSLSHEGRSFCDVRGPAICKVYEPHG